MIKKLFTLALLGSAPAHAAISITADNLTELTITNTSSSWDTTTFPPSNLANVYIDLDLDGIFGEVGIGENTANTQPELNFVVPTIADGTILHFGLEGFGGAGANPVGSITFTLTNTDASTQVIVVNEGVTTGFSDSNGDQWEADFEFNSGFYGNVVFNGGTTGTGTNVQDHQGVLTFSQIPEPSSALLTVVAGLFFIRRKR